MASKNTKNKAVSPSSNDVTKMMSSILSSITTEVAVIDEHGQIIYVNKAWTAFANKNNSNSRETNYIGSNYLSTCKKAAENGSADGKEVYEGLLAVIAGEKQEFIKKYPLNSPTHNHWFQMTARAMDDGEHILIMHENITEQAEMEMDLNIKNDSMNHSSTPVCFADLNQKITYVNPAFWKLFGFENENEVLGKSIVELATSEKKIKEIINAVQKDEKWSGEDIARKKDGTIIHIYVSITLIKDQTGTPISMSAFFMDLTARVKKTQQLVETENNSKLFLNNSPGMFWQEDFSAIKIYLDQLKAKGVTDFKKYFDDHPGEVDDLVQVIKFSNASQSILDFFQVQTMDDMLLKLDELMTPESWVTFKNELAELATGRTDFESEIPFLSSEGKTFNFYIKKTIPTQYLDTWEVMLVSLIDISELRENEKIFKQHEKQNLEHSNWLEEKVAVRTQELRESETKLLQAQELAKMGTWEWNIATDEIWWSDQVYKNLGLTKDTNPSNQLFMDLIHPDDVDRITKQHEKDILEPSEIESHKYRIITPAGEIRFLHTIAHQILDENNKVIKMVGALIDITELEKAENLKVQVEAVLQGQELERERIAADLHDSINPLLSIASFNVESLLEYSKDKVNFPKEKLNKTINILSEAVQGVKEISKNLSPALLRSFGLERALNHLCEDLSTTLDLDVECQIYGLEKRLDPKIELALYRIAQELFNNIVKHSKAKEVEFQLVLHKNSLVMMIRDDGIGINEDAKQMKTNGSGLKNVLSRTESLNGSMNIDSANSKGATITIEIPVF